jgi:hypothetical protein
MSAARLKVYRTHSGFYDVIVAVPSQKAALSLWGTRQNLFARGLASVVGDDAIIKLAKAKPGIVLRRPFGSSEPFREHSRPVRKTDIPPPKRAVRPKKAR